MPVAANSATHVQAGRVPGLPVLGKERRPGSSRGWTGFPEVESGSTSMSSLVSTAPEVVPGTLPRAPRSRPSLINRVADVLGPPARLRRIVPRSRGSPPPPSSSWSQSGATPSGSAPPARPRPGSTGGAPRQRIGSGVALDVGIGLGRAGTPTTLPGSRAAACAPRPAALRFPRGPHPTLRTSRLRPAPGPRSRRANARRSGHRRRMGMLICTRHSFACASTTPDRRTRSRMQLDVQRQEPRRA